MQKVDLLKKADKRMSNHIPKANKDLGQHYLNSQHVIQKICDDHSGQYDAIIEVGPGPGVLTKELARKAKPLFLIEMDTRFETILKDIVPSENITFTDATQIHWQEFFAKKGLTGKKIWLVSNLPYNVGSVLFLNFLPLKSIQFMTLMFQKEVGQKTYIRNVKNEMNGLLTLSKNYCDPKELIKVSPGCFSPPPKVDSIVVSYIKKENPDIDDFKNLNKFCRLTFSNKRKQLFGILKKEYSPDKLEIAFEKVSIFKTIRAEALTYNQVIALYHELN